MTQQGARALLGLLLAALFVGTQMPGDWKDAALQPLHSPLDLAAAAHVALFTAIGALLPRARPWPVQSWHVFLTGLLLALLTEGLQFFAIDRHPNLAGLVQDMTGTLMGWVLARRWVAARPREKPATGQASGVSSRDRASRPSDK